MNLINEHQYDCTLEDFQKGVVEIPEEENLNFINNTEFINKWYFLNTEYFYYFNTNKFRFLLLFLNKFFEKKTGNYFFPKEDKLIFFGDHGGFLNYTATISLNNILELIFKLLIKNSDYSYILVFGKSDFEITDKFSSNIPPNVRCVFANNINTKSTITRYLPIGRDFRSSEFFNEIKPSFTKDRSCYCNFSLNTHKIREQLYDSIKNSDFIEFEHMGKFLKYSIGRKDFYEKMSKSKFVVCPRGNGIDTFRLWDSLYLGAIPIVVKEAVFHEYLDDLPILFLDSYDDFKKLNEETLEEIYQKMLKKKYNYKKLLISYWINKIESC